MGDSEASRCVGVVEEVSLIASAEVCCCSKGGSKCSTTDSRRHMRTKKVELRERDGWQKGHAILWGREKCVEAERVCVCACVVCSVVYEGKGER